MADQLSSRACIRVLLVLSCVMPAVGAALVWPVAARSSLLPFWLAPTLTILAGLAALATAGAAVLLSKEWQRTARRLDDVERARLDVEHMAFHDGLTGLLNRRALENELSRLAQVTASGGKPFALHVLDLDDLKGINDRYGHVAGDRVLAALADRLHRSVRDGDTVARIGGDEFVVLQPGATVETAATLARRLSAAVAEPLTVGGHVLTATVSVGTAFSDDDPCTTDLIQRADQSLYVQKARRRTRIRSVTRMAEALPAPHRGS
ncbi:MAG: GGDEF domain-containing protein [Pseudomonadota bacterium]